MPLKRRTTEDLAPGRITVSKGSRENLAVFGGRAVTARRVRTRGDALRLLNEGQISESNYREVVDLLPAGRTDTTHEPLED